MRQRAIEVARELNLLHVGDNRAIDLSGGQKKLLELGRALMAEPKLIMLDEPAAGINPTLAKKLGEHILALKARGITFLIIEHNMGLVAALCDHVVVLVQGKPLHRRPLRRSARRPARAGSLHGASGMMLSVTNVVAGYGAHDEVLKGVGITVAERELVVLIGPNGAGKSTLLKSIAGFLKPREGAITFEGKPIGGLRPREITRQGIAFVPQEANVFPSLSVEANLEIGGYVDRRATKERMQAIFARFPMLAERRAQEARTLSGGQRQMLAVAMALMAAPRLMLLDEPSAGLSPAASAELFASDQGAAPRRHDCHHGRAERARCTCDCGSRLSAGRRLQRARGTTRARSPRMRRYVTHSLAADRCYHRINIKGGLSCPSRLITRRNALLTGAGAIAAPFVITTPGFGQTGPIKIAGLVSLDRLGLAVRTEQPHRASGGGRSGERRGRPARPQARISLRGRPDQRRSRRARRAQADRRRQGAGDHERVGVRGRQRGAAALLGKQGDDAGDLGRRLDRGAAAPGLFRAHAAAHRSAGPGNSPSSFSRRRRRALT